MDSTSAFGMDMVQQNPQAKTASSEIENVDGNISFDLPYGPEMLHAAAQRSIQQLYQQEEYDTSRFEEEMALDSMSLDGLMSKLNEMDLRENDEPPAT